MPWDSDHLRVRLQKSGFSPDAISAAWPGWWSHEAEESASAQAELRFSLARKFGLDPRALLEDDQPTFVWREAKFKRLTGESENERSALSSYGIAVGRMLVSGTPTYISVGEMSALALRFEILRHSPFVSLGDLISLCWAIGIPVIHLRVFPLAAKRMCAMSINVGGRFAILLGKDAEYPAHVAFYLAHELGHIALGHLKDDTALVDLSDPLGGISVSDREENDADKYALELLTGSQKLEVISSAQRFTAQHLGETLLRVGQDLHVEPGTLALCFGYTTGNWAKANAALKTIYTKSKPVWREVNRIAESQIEWDALPDDLISFIHALMGGSLHANDSC